MITLRCYHCGKVIKSGYFCNSCKDYLIEKGIYEREVLKIIKANSIAQLKALKALYNKEIDMN